MSEGLPDASLDVFPVGYPSDTVSDHLSHDGTSRRGRAMNRFLERDQSPIEITFRDSFGGQRDRSGNQTVTHGAIDIFGARGLPVFAACAGKVVDQWRARGQQLDGAGEADRGGNFVMLQDAEGRYHYYAHMTEAPSLVTGVEVRAGQQLGQVGHSGSQAYGTHPHLHYQVSWRNEHGAHRSFISPYSELVRLARACGGNFENSHSVVGIPARHGWMVVRQDNFVAGGSGRRQ